MTTTTRKFPVETLTPDEARRLMKACTNNFPTGIRNRALVVALWRCGLRISEALDLRPKDIDPDAGTIRVLHGKGDKCRVVGCDPTAMAVIEKWLDRRQGLNLPGPFCGPVFCTLKGKPLDSRYVRNLMKRLARKAGIEKRVHCHALRHTFASELRQEGVEIGIISKQLGHDSIATTARYLDHVAPKEVIEAMRARVWQRRTRRRRV